MNLLEGHITHTEVNGTLMLCSIKSEDLNFTTINLIEDAGHFTIGKVVKIGFKENEVFILKGDPKSLSIRNRIPCTIEHIEKGKLLSRIHLLYNEHKITSVITTNAVNQLELEMGDAVFALIKTNEIILL